MNRSKTSRANAMIAFRKVISGDEISGHRGTRRTSVVGMNSLSYCPTEWTFANGFTSRTLSENCANQKPYLSVRDASHK